LWSIDCPIPYNNLAIVIAADKFRAAIVKVQTIDATGVFFIHFVHNLQSFDCMQTSHKSIREPIGTFACRITILTGVNRMQYAKTMC
jgi:hypothetical protein